MSLTTLAALLLAQVNPGLPPPGPADGPFDTSSVCYTVLADEAKEAFKAGKDTRYLDRATGFFAAQVLQQHAGGEQLFISKAREKIATDPGRFRATCFDVINTSFAMLARRPWPVRK